MDKKSFIELLKQLDKQQLAEFASTREGKLAMAVIMALAFAVATYFGYSASDVCDVIEGL